MARVLPNQAGARPQRQRGLTLIEMIVVGTLALLAVVDYHKLVSSSPPK